MFRGKYETYSARREIIQRTPDISVNQQSLIRMIQKHRLSFIAIVECYVERAA